MQVEAIYKHGRLEFLAPLRLTRDQFPVKVELPDDVVTELAEEDSPFLTGVRQILGPLHRQRPHVGVAEDKEAYLEALMEKYQR